MAHTLALRFRMRWETASLAIAFASILSCGDSSHSVAPNDVHRDCKQPITPRCSHLAIVTAREPMSGSDAPVPQSVLLIEKSGVYAYEYPALLQRFEIDGLPPRLHATSNVLLTPTPSIPPSVTDGDGLFGAVLHYDAHDNRSIEVQFWNASNALVGDYTMPISASWG